MTRSDLSTFLPTLGLLGAVLKKIRLKTHKKHKKSTLKACGTVGEWLERGEKDGGKGWREGRRMVGKVGEGLERGRKDGGRGWREGEGW